MTAAGTGDREGNPFPGLRPFREDEEYLFFGRENQVDAMVDELAATRFLAVVGTSGSGKSSLVNCGLHPALRRGLMARAGTAWRIAQFRPGGGPVRAMARALAQDRVLFKDYDAGGLSLAEIVETTLRMSKLGLIDIVEQARLEADVNLLVVVDQFEELFRYRQAGGGKRGNARDAGDDATAFVNLLLEAHRQTTLPLYAVLTMRSDFLGDCAQFAGLAEAINAGQYLVPRLTRDERRAAITGPVRVGGGDISPVLLTRLVNDVGDNPDQLSILQHALNRTWASWQQSGGTGPLELAHYEAIGTMSHALDRHAERAYEELTTDRQRQLCERALKALTDKATDPRGVRRPTTLCSLCALAGATEAEIVEVIDVFRKPSRSFLMPPAGEAINVEDIVDISHESLMRVWQRLETWANEEARSAHIYERLADTALLHKNGHAGLLQPPELGVALKWRAEQKPNLEWAQRYHPAFTETMTFLEESEEQANASEEKRVRRAKIGRTFFFGALLTVFAGLLCWMVYVQFDSETEAGRQLRTWQEQVRREQEPAAREARDQKLFSDLVASIRTTPADPAQVQDPKQALQLLGPGNVYRELAEKLDPGKLAPALESLLKLYRALDSSDLAEAQKTYLAMVRDSSVALAPAKLAWDGWANIRKAEARERRLIASLYGLGGSMPASARTAEALHAWVAYSNKLEEANKLEETLFVSPVHFDVATRLVSAQELAHEDELLVRFYSALEHGSPGSDAEEALRNWLASHPRDRHAVVAQSALRAASEARDRALISRLCPESVCQSGKSGKSANERKFSEQGRGPAGDRFEVPGGARRSEGVDSRYVNQRSELDPNAFANSVHFVLACKLVRTRSWEQNGQAVMCELPTGSPELLQEEQGLVQVYYALQAKDKSKATENLRSLEGGSGYVSAYYLLGASALGDPEIPTRASLIAKMAGWVAELKWLIALLLVGPVWLGWRWLRRKFGKPVQVNAKAHPIRRLLAGFADLGFASTFGVVLGGLLGAICWIVVGVVAGSYLEAAQVVGWVVGVLVALCAFSAYLLLRDAIKFRFHRSLGKILFGLRPVVTNPEGAPMTKKLSAKRNALLVVVVGLVLLAPVLFLLFMELSSQAGMVAMFLVVPLILVYLLVELVLSAVSGGRTIRDRLSKTRVINIRSEEAKALDLKMRRSSAAEQWSAPAA